MDHAQELMILFAGNDTAYGTYEVQRQTQSGKQVGKADTKRGEVTVKHWQDHIAGEIAIGIIPIRTDSHCLWGCIDVDDYNIDQQKLSKKLADNDLPLLLCSTKSKGAHLYAFFEKPIASIELQKWLKSIAAGLGYGDMEIFPKQNEILKDRGDIGNWLNMPYYGGEESTRKCIAPNGKSLTIAQFLKVAYKIRIDPDKIWEYSIKEIGGLLDEGPPCLQVLCQNGFPEGTRNNGLFNLGVFARKKFPEKWKDTIETLNRDHMDPPLPSQEVQGIIKQHEKKDYEYKCNETPICSFCNSSVCRTRKFGIGAGGAMPSINGLTKLDTEPPIWFLTVDGERIELTTESLQQQEKFQRVCMETLNIMPPKLKMVTWQTIVQGLLDNVIIIEQPEDVKMSGAFIEMLEAFTTARAHKEQKDDILRGLSWTDKGKSYFRLRDFVRYCKNQGYPIERNYASARIRDQGGDTLQLWVENKNLSLWWVPAFTIPDRIKLSPPEESRI